MFSGRSNSVTPVTQYKYREKSGSKKYTVICLTVICFCLVGLGTALIVIGIKEDIQDLLILGPIFLIAGIAFTILMVVIILRPICQKKATLRAIKKKNEKIAKAKSVKRQESEKGSIKLNDSQPYIEDIKTKLKEADNVNQRKGPPYDQLYGKHNAKELVKTNSLPPGVVEVTSGAYVEESEDLLASPKTMDLPSYDQLYKGKKVTFSISLEPDDTQLKNNKLKSGGVVNDTESTGSPVPSVVEYSLPNETTDSNIYSTNL